MYKYRLFIAALVKYYYMVRNKVGGKMEKKTHVALGNLVALSIVNPGSINSLLITIGAASLGGILSDVDLKDSTTDKLFDRLITSLITVIVVGIFINYLFDINLYSKIKEFNNAFNYIICISLFTIMAYMGSKTHHRSFTHSFLGLFIYTFILSYAFNKAVIVPFFLAYLSHILIDLFNKKGLTLFYPVKSRFCLNLCDANGMINKLLFSLFLVLNVVVLVMLGIKT